MELFENKVGRPTNEIKKKRRNFIFIVSAIVLCLTLSISLFLLKFNHNTKSFRGATYTNPGYVLGNLSWKGKKYSLSDSNLRFLTGICYREQGDSVLGIQAEATLMANRFELYGKNYGTGANGLINYVRTSKYFGPASEMKSIDKYNLSTNNKNKYIKAVKEVLVNGWKILPPYVDQHDCLSCNTKRKYKCSNTGKNGDVCKIRTILPNKTSYIIYTSTSTINNRNNYVATIKDGKEYSNTIIENTYADDRNDSYTFYAFSPIKKGDVFGYTDYAFNKTEKGKKLYMLCPDKIYKDKEFYCLVETSDVTLSATKANLSSNYSSSFKTTVYDKIIRLKYTKKNAYVTITATKSGYKTAIIKLKVN